MAGYPRWIAEMTEEERAQYFAYCGGPEKFLESLRGSGLDVRCEDTPTLAKVARIVTGTRNRRGTFVTTS